MPNSVKLHSSRMISKFPASVRCLDSHLFLIFLATCEELVSTIENQTPARQRDEYKLLFLPFRRTRWVLPEVHLRRSMVICSAGEAATLNKRSSLRR
nr:hypothetical protein Iba_chr03eCG5920 [Ipomoea batatas]GME02627.1 hypothetical protein Iba_scaffold137CG1100 [Ipomoea batatas]